MKLTGRKKSCGDDLDAIGADCLTMEHSSTQGLQHRSELEEIAKAHGTALLRQANRLTRDHADAWDLVQDTLVRALTCLPPLLPPLRMRGWLMVVLRNLYSDRCRARRRHEALELTEETAAVDPDVERGQPPMWLSIDAEQVRSCLDHLSPSFREAYVLREEHGLSLADVAARLNVPLATVGTRVFRARRQLRELLTREKTIGVRENSPA